MLTRPLQESTALAGDLKGVGFDSVVMPLYAFSGFKPAVDVAAILANAEGRRLLVFTSPRAVEFGLDYVPVAQRSGLEFAVVGDATRRKLAAAGLQVSWQPDNGFTSEDLLALPGLALPGQSIAGPSGKAGTAIVMCAPDGRGVLKPGLKALGWVAHNAMVYQRQWLIPAQDQVARIMAAESLLSVWTSTSAISGAEKHLPAAAWRKVLKQPALVVSARIKHHLQQQGASEISIASGPGNVDLLQSIRNFVEQQSRL